MSGEELKEAIQNWQKKQYHWEIELSKVTSAVTKFELREQIEECNREITRLKTSQSFTTNFAEEVDYSLLRQLKIKIITR